jgi:ABC-type uncharacterized transport system permease subunit
MSGSLILPLSAIMAMVPLVLVPPRQPQGQHKGRNVAFFSALAVAVAGPFAVAADHLAAGALATLATALWLGVAASSVMFAGLAILRREAAGLAPLLASYLILMSLLALLVGSTGAPVRVSTDSGWLGAHVAVSVATYGLLTLAAIAGLAIFAQELALRHRREPTALTRALPALAELETLQVGLLAASTAVLGVGLLTGMATEYLESGQVLRFDHKTVLSLLAFAVLTALLLVHFRLGMGGKRGARLVLLAYLLLTLAYPGVKFVREVLGA